MKDLLKRVLPHNFNDSLALVVLLILGGILYYLARYVPDLRREVFIAIIPWGTIVIQYYFRKQPPETGG